MISYFSFYKPLFMVQLLVAEWLFSHRITKRKYFALRYITVITMSILLSILLTWQPTGAVELSLLFLLFFAFTYLLHLVCYDVSCLELLFCMIAAYVVQHFSYCLSNCILLISNLNYNIYGVYTGEVLSTQVPVSDVFGWIFTFIVYYFSYYLFFILFGHRMKKGERPKLKNFSVLVMSIVAISVSILVNAMMIYGTSNRDLMTVVYIYNATCCAFIVYMMFSVLSKSTIEAELNMVKQLLDKAGEQYEMSKETIELINIKCHDLKQQVRAIGQANLIKEDALAEISKVISIYESDIKTGKKPLDIILTEKSLACQKNAITLTCMADGKQLDFMSDSEIYSLFGNALDNAIAAVMKCQDQEKRCIGLNVCRIKDFVKINIHNYYQEELKYTDEGLLATTKQDKENHGYGLKSIRYIISKYGGSISINGKNEIFNLNIIIPIKEKM